ncbi:Lyase [Paracoccus homiensis]|uniref:Lyase n=1 Tax=Paracoccus homiensis TaxID=364199 RepID=A0A1I0IPD1_9RHOB|nr:Lyase [Paracoccus homiensis]
MILGDKFRSFASAMHEDIARVRQLSSLLTEVNLGATAVGTRITALDGYGILLGSLAGLWSLRRI